MLKHGLLGFAPLKTSLSREIRAPSLSDQHTTDKTEASKKIEVQAKGDILAFCFLTAQKILSAFGYLILHRLQLGGICQLDCNWGGGGGTIRHKNSCYLCKSTLFGTKCRVFCAIFSVKRSKFVVAIQNTEAQWDLNST